MKNDTDLSKKSNVAVDIGLLQINFLALAWVLSDLVSCCL